MQKIKDITTIGFALFAMFFGAGNLLLPPFIGIHIGDQVWLTILAFGLTGILLPFMGILSVTQAGESFQDLGARIHPKLAPILGTIIMICIGPLIAIPRTAATTFEVGILPSFPDSNPIWTTIGFMGITWLFSIVPSKVVDLVGNILTPCLLLLLTGLLIMGFLHPAEQPVAGISSASDAFTLGFTEGYQTLDVLASVIFAGIIITAAKTKGYQQLRDKNKVVIASGALAAACLLFIYGGLIYLGASSGIHEPEIKRSELLIQISNQLLGQYGSLAIALSIALACLTTSIALTTAVGTFFHKLSKGRLSYGLLVTLCSLLSGILSITGVDGIIRFAYPPLAFVYPIVITLVLTVVCFRPWVKSRWPYLGALIVATLMAFLNVLNILELLSEQQVALLQHIPFFNYELGWVLPTFASFLVLVLWEKAWAKR